MKKLIALLTIAVLTTNLHATSELKTVTDERMELLSIVSKLAGFPEYNKNKIKFYNDSVDSYFSNFKTHPVIKTAQKMRAEHTFQYDGIFDFSTHLVIENDSIFINPNLNIEKADGRWFNKLTSQFLAELNDFYIQSNVNGFFEANREVYQQYDDYFNEKVVKKIHTQWFGDFFGVSRGGFHIRTTFLTAPFFYGSTTIDKLGEENAFTANSAAFNKEGKAQSNIQWSISVVVHEFAHSYCNPAIRKYVDTLDPYAEIIYERMGENIKKDPYNAREAVLYEGFVRTIELVYAKKFNNSFDKILSQYKKIGFYWLEDMGKKLEEYENNRDKYKNINDFIPEIVQFYIDLAEKEP